VVRFGNFEVDLLSGELRRSGLAVKLQGQPFQVLAMLLERPGELVTREEMRQRLWPGDTFVDFEHSLNAAVKRLRDALGESAEKPVFIETVPRRGYRIIAPVRAMVATPAAIAVALRRKYFPAMGLSVLGLSLVVCTILLLYPSKVVRSGPTITPVVTDLGTKNGLALSPEAQRVAYSWDGGFEGSLSIYVKVIGTSEPLRLTHAAAQDFSPVWSPDGRHIAFARMADGQAGIFIVPALGGVERKLISTHWDGSYVRYLRPRIAWARDGELMAYSDIPGPGESPSIFLVRLDSLQPTRLTHPPNGLGGDFNPAFSDDGRRIAFIRDGKEVFNIGLVATSGGTEQILGSPIMGITATMSWQSGRMIISNGRLYEFSMAHGTLVPLAWANDAFYPSLQADRLAFLQSRESINLWSHRLSATGEPRPVSRTTRQTLQPTFSPDGAQLAFVSTSSGAPEIWMSRSDGALPVQLTKFGGPELGAPQWSPDGKQIAFDSRVGSRAQIFLMNVDGGLPRRVPIDSDRDADHVVPRWSRDGQWIYYSSNVTGNWQLWKTPIAEGKALQVTRYGGFAAFESQDGKFVYYSKGEKIAGIWRVPTAGGEETPILDLPQVGYWAYWAIVDNGLLYLDAERTDHPWICFFDLETHRRTRIFELPKPVVPFAPGLAVSPDRVSVIYPQVDSSYSDIALADKIW
jgi:Tol biopolymer transport system component/DNA-binding winged helix-turn-helix (wHTH) protein